MLTLFIALEIIGPCSTKPLATLNAVPAMTVGEATISTLNKYKIPYQGTEKGINTLYSLPTPAQSLEILSDSDMRAYGWCFDVDGEVPEEYPDQIEIHEGMKKIRWFHGYAEMKNGVWVSQCKETAKLRPDFLCR